MTDYRDQLQQDAAAVMQELIRQMQEGTLEDPQLEWQMETLARRLQTVKGKKVYGYLPPEVKLMVDGIVDVLAADERVAKAYDLWNEMRETICRTYSENLPERLPLSRQKEFKPVRNMVIREALQLARQEAGMAEEPQQETNLRHIQRAAESDDPAVQGDPFAQTIIDHPGQDWSIAAQSVTRLLYHMSRIFENNCKTDAMHRGLQIDRKRRRQLREKRLAMGHKPDDHENEEINLR